MSTKKLFKVDYLVLLRILIGVLIFLGIRGVLLVNNPVIDGKTMHVSKIENINELIDLNRFVNKNSIATVYYLNPQAIKDIKKYDYKLNYLQDLEFKKDSNFAYISSESKLGKELKQNNPKLTGYTRLVAPITVDIVEKDNKTKIKQFKAIDKIQAINPIIMGINRSINYILLIFLLFTVNVSFMHFYDKYLKTNYLEIKLKYSRKDVDLVVMVNLVIGFILLMYIILNLVDIF